MKYENMKISKYQNNFRIIILVCIYLVKLCVSYSKTIYIIIILL